MSQSGREAIIEGSNVQSFPKKLLYWGQYVFGWISPNMFSSIIPIVIFHLTSILCLMLIFIVGESGIRRGLKWGKKHSPRSPEARQALY